MEANFACEGIASLVPIVTKRHRLVCNEPLISYYDGFAA